MGFVEKYISGSEYKWFWFISSLLGGASPMVVSTIVRLNSDKWDWLGLYNIVDLIFFGLAMNISNLNLVGSKKFRPQKAIIVLLSFTGMFFLAFCLGLVYVQPDIKFAFKIFLHLLVAGSIYLSLSANNFVYETVRKRNF